MDFNVTIGLTHTTENIVAYKDTAASLGSGFVEVLATPMMIAVMEGTCAACVAAYLPEGFSTVGTHVNVSHKAAVKIGETYFTECELIDVDRKKLTFRVKTYTQNQLVGEGTHERFIIDMAKFMK
ncbi:MAG: thioesterase family protein [Tissierellales bacterium]|jgi:fluoroacetyl-CoA thioesterase|nr:thioesterase family protein [Tissierellales bacterium]MBN2827341.1 thioesterase family protein [Tissierellales bacterium]